MQKTNRRGSDRTPILQAKRATEAFGVEISYQVNDSTPRSLKVTKEQAKETCIREDKWINRKGLAARFCNTIG